MRLNRENTLIENNLYPLAGFKPADVQAKFVSVLKPFETDILNIESALLLHNIPLFGALAGFFIGFWLLSRIICPAVISTLSYAFIVIPLFHLFYLVGGVDFEVEGAHVFGAVEMYIGVVGSRAHLVMGEGVNRVVVAADACRSFGVKQQGQGQNSDEQGKYLFHRIGIMCFYSF